MIQTLFKGEYAYVTTCLTCKRESLRPEIFYELDLALAGKNLSVEKCLEGFLKVEKMVGDEKYFCEGCQSKQVPLNYLVVIVQRTAGLTLFLINPISSRLTEGGSKKEVDLSQRAS